MVPPCSRSLASRERASRAEKRREPALSPGTPKIQPVDALPAAPPPDPNGSVVAGSLVALGTPGLLRPVVAEMISIANAFGREFSAAEFRDKLDNGRKVAILILEFFDRHGVTVRRGDLRRVVPQKLEQYGAPPKV